MSAKSYLPSLDRQFLGVDAGYWKLEKRLKPDFWQFLNLNFSNQLEVLAQRFLIFRQKLSKVPDTEVYQDNVVFSEFVVNLDDIVKKLCDYQDAIERIYNDRAEYLVLGRDFLEVKYELKRAAYLSFPYNYSAPIYPDRYSNMFRGMKIVIVPWMDGLAILPRLEK